VVVTGGAGFIGANLCRALAVAPGVDAVVAVDDLSTGSRANLEGIGGVSLLEGTILDPALLDDALAGADAVVHLAARGSVPKSVAHPMATHHANSTGTIEVLEAVRRAGNPHVVLASSSSVYGANPKLPRSETDMLMPMSPYAVSKVATEQYALAYAACYGLEVLPFRFFNVFGPLQPAGHDYAAVVPVFLAAAMAGHPLPLQGDGKQTRDFTFVETVCSVIVDALQRHVTTESPVNLAFGTRVSLLELIETIEAVLGTSVAVEQHPARAGDVRESQADQTLLRSLFPDVKPVSLEDGLRRTADWFRSQS
jgi:UDP-glucose 4-epimerase